MDTPIVRCVQFTDEATDHTRPIVALEGRLTAGSLVSVNIAGFGESPRWVFGEVVADPLAHVVKVQRLLHARTAGN